MDLSKKLYKSNDDKMWDGVCAGLAKYFEINPAVIRLAFLVLTFCDLIGLLVYVCGMVLLPREPVTELNSQAESKRVVNNGLFWGSALILIGGILLLDRLDLFEWRWYWRHFGWRYLVPTAMIVMGLIIIFSRNARSFGANFSGFSGIHRQMNNRKIFGVCSGLAYAWNVDVSAIRMAWVLATFILFPLGVLLYFVLAVILPRETIKPAENKTEGVS